MSIPHSVDQVGVGRLPEGLTILFGSSESLTFGMISNYADVDMAAECELFQTGEGGKHFVEVGAAMSIACTKGRALSQTLFGG
jgi:hypothetical protein